MGNYVSCTLPTPLMKNAKAVRVIFPGGEVRQFRERVNAAELMMERPNFFICNSQSLHIGKRFNALSADEELECGNFYVMFPMKRVNSMVTAADLTLLFMAANSASKRISGGRRDGKVRVLPESIQKEEENDIRDDPRLIVNEEGVGGDNEGFLLGAEFKYRLSVCRSKKPMLETIKEEHVSSR